MKHVSKYLWVMVVLSLLAGCEAKPDVGAMPASESAGSGNTPAIDWSLHGRDIGEQRHMPATQINRDTVADLGLAWSFDFYTKRGVEATPLVVDGTLYVTSSWSMVYALDARSGQLKWFYDPQVERRFLAKGCCDAVNRGVAYHDGKIFLGAYDGRLIALNATDGSLVWSVQTTDREQSYTITGAPRIANDKVVIGNGGAELGVRGYVSAYSADSGALAWRFYTVPGDPALGFENPSMEMAAKTWTGEWWKFGGGGTVWDSMVFDPELNLLYVGVGNGSPWNQHVRSPQGGDNLFLSSIVALNADTGEYVWHYQTTPGDTWDFTATQHIILADLDIDGEPRKVLMQAPKNGFFYVIDRVTGELVSAKPFTAPITWASHIDMQTGRPVETPVARIFDGRNVHLPSNAGAHNWPPMSFNPDSGLVFIPAMIFPVAFLAPSEDKDRLPGQGYWNVGFDRMGNASPKIPEPILAAEIDKHTSGSLIGWDPRKGEARWIQPNDRPSVGGTLSTGAGLVFYGKNSRLVAANVENGEIVWEYETYSGIAAAPVSYVLDGEQYIAVAAGFMGGLFAEAGPVLHGWKLPNIPRLLVFKLGASQQLPVPEKVSREMPEPPPVTASAEVIGHGEVIFQRHCSYCHGDGLRTGGATPDLRRSSAQIHSIWQQIVREGVLAPAGMVGFADYLSEDDAEAIRQYVLAEANRLYQDMQAEK